MTTVKLDVTGYSKSEIKKICDLHGYSKSTFYRSWNRKWITVEVEVE